MAPPLLVIVGPTATGKTRVVESAAHSLIEASAWPGVEAVAADAMQVYRGMDIGTDKPPAGAREGSLRYHLLDVVEPTQTYSAARFQREAVRAIGDIQRRGYLPILVGGTGLYMRAVVDGLDFAPGGPSSASRRALEARADREGAEALHAELAARDPVAAERIPATNVRRVVRALEWLAAGETPSERHAAFNRRPVRPGVAMVGLKLPRDVLRERIAERVHSMVAAGLQQEVRGLWETGRLGRTAAQAIGYKEFVEHFEGRLSREDAIERIIGRTRQYAKRQLTWFGRDERVTWLDASDERCAAQEVARRAIDIRESDQK